MLSVSTEGMLRVRDSAYRNKERRFTSLLHLATPQLFEIAFENLKHNSAAGVDNVQWHEYESLKDFKERLSNLRERVFNGSYRALPVRRTFIPKQDGKSLRPLGIVSIEDKIVQQVVKMIIEPLYESIFCGMSYGFRPNLGCHDALDALYVCIAYKKVNYVLDADIKGYFDSIPHDKLMELINLRIGDPRILRLIRKWLGCGVLEDGFVKYSKTGATQGAIISPLLANIYLHYVLDKWIINYRSKGAQRVRGEMYYVRYADDFIVLCQYEDDAKKFWGDLERRLSEYGLQLQTDKSRLIKFGRFAAGSSIARGKEHPETFDFLGFTHICSKSYKNGKFKLLRKTIAKRMNRKIQEYKEGIRKRMHSSIDNIVSWLQRSLSGYYRYFAIHDNLDRLLEVRYRVILELGKVLRRRSQRAWKTVTWDYVFSDIAPRIPYPTVMHPYPITRFRQKWQLD